MSNNEATSSPQIHPDIASVTIRQASADEGDLVGRLAHALLAELYPDYARDIGEAGFIAKAHRALAQSIASRAIASGAIVSGPSSPSTKARRSA